MDFLSILYPVSVFIFVRISLFSFVRWSTRRSVGYLILGIVAMAFTIDSGIQLIGTAALAPYWWMLPLVIFALVYVFFITIRKSWRSIGKHTPTKPT